VPGLFGRWALSGDGFILRDFLPTDLPALVEMVDALCVQHRAFDPGRYDFLPDVGERYSKWLPLRASDQDSVLIVAAGPGPVGFVVGEVLDEIPIFVTRRYGFIHDVYVAPAARRTGVGRALVEAAVARFRARGVHQVRLDTAAGNETARELFSSLGFRPTVVQMQRDLFDGHAHPGNRA